MSQLDDPKRPGIRRVTRKDRKRKLDAPAQLSLPDDDPRFAPPLDDDSRFRPPHSPAGDDLRFAPPAPPPPPAAEAAAADIPPAAPVQPAPPEIAPAPPPAAAADRFPPLPEALMAAPADAAPPPPAAAAGRRFPPLLANLVAAAFLALALAAAGIFALIWADPYHPINPFPPFTPLPVFITTTPLPPTATFTPTPGPTATFTPLPITPQADDGLPFALAPEGVVYAPNGNGRGCAWSSIAGTVTDASGLPLNGYGVRVVGEGVDATASSGGALTFGSGGYELPLGEAPRAAPYLVQLFDPDGRPVSAVVTVSTRGDCEGAVALVSFVGR